METQRTIADSVTLSGRGLFGSAEATLTFKPAQDDHGIVFVRRDLDGARVPALVRYVVDSPRRTTLERGRARVETCEHCLSALAGLGIDNAIVEVNAPELPLMDGSAQPFLEALNKAGIRRGAQPRRLIEIREPLMVEKDGAVVAVMPRRDPGLEVVYSLEYEAPAIGHQVRSIRITEASYAREIAPARTYATEAEAQALRKQGFGKHLTAEQMLVIGEKGPLGGNRFRFEDEPVRHKILDLVGDISLVGAPVQGRIIASRSGHTQNHELSRRIVEQSRHNASQHRLLDTRKLTRILPHRYPMLLVDRVMEVDGDRFARGIKNVTVNEPFFQGHYPGTPIMPGVLIVEAMAQLAGVLIGQNLEHTGKLPILLSLDRVKLRRPVTPGDQLVLEAESVRVRRRIAHLRCQAHLGGDVAAEAEIKFMLVDEEEEEL